MTGEGRFRGSLTAEAFRDRRDRIFQRLGQGAMVLPAAPVRYRSADSEHRYRPDSELYFATGLEEPEALAVLRGHADEERFVLFLRERDPEAEQWSGSRLGPEGAMERLAADAAYPIDELSRRLPDLLHGAAKVYFRLGAAPEPEAAVREALRWSRRRGARTGQGPRSVVDPGQVLDELRIIKDAPALESLRRAADLTVAAFHELAGALAPGVGEWELEALLESRFRAGGGSGPAFGTIVGAGENGCVLHYVDNSRVLERGQLVLVDAGAEVDFYAGDVTRTFPVSGGYTPEQRQVYEVVAAAQARAVDAVRPGAPVADVHQAAVEVLVEGLREMGVIDAGRDEALEQGLYRPYYPHQTSHWLGLDVHEPGDYAHPGGESRRLEPGMVLTVEPGLYFRPGGDEAAAPFQGIGVRLEDDVLVTGDGAERLTGALPVAADAVAALVGATGS